MSEEVSAREVLEILHSEPESPSAELASTEEEKKTLWKRIIEWFKQLPGKVKSVLCGIPLDIDNEATVGDLLNINKAYAWYKRAGPNGVEIHCPTELKPGDHIAVKKKHTNFWWNHMIVVDAYYDGIDVISPCSYENDHDEVCLESDLLSLVDFSLYFRTHHGKSDMKVWEFPLRWESVEKVVRFDRDENCPFSTEEILERARAKLVAEDAWDLYNNSSEGFVHEILTGIAPGECTEHLQAKVKQKCTAVCGELVIAVPSFSLKNVHNVFKVVLLIAKWIVKLVVHSDTIKCVSIISKVIKVLRFIGLAIGPIIDVIVCIYNIRNKRKRYKSGEITKKDFYTYVAKEIGELATNLILTIISGLCILIPIPVINIIVSIGITIVGFFYCQTCWIFVWQGIWLFLGLFLSVDNYTVINLILYSNFFITCIMTVQSIASYIGDYF